MKKFLMIFWIAFISFSAYADATVDSEMKTENYFETIKTDPLELYIFLRNFPKGGDLHNHLAGAIYAEDLIKCSKDDSSELTEAENNPAYYRKLINTWSMSDFIPGLQSGEAHFFATFFKFMPFMNKHIGHLLSAVVSRAGWDNVDYLELMTNAYELGVVDNIKIIWNTDFEQMQQKSLPQINYLVPRISAHLDNAEKVMRTQLQCNTAHADPGCQVKVRYIYYAVREFPPEQVFASLLTGFELAKRDPRFVGVNIVAPENGPRAVKDYLLHMQMFNYLHKIYPQVHISLHAGEFSSTNVTPDVLRNHIRQAIEIGHAERIGHGVSIVYEDNAKQLLQEMVNKQIMVEINLTSNLSMLRIEGNKHPFLLYMRYHVPVALSTDDEGVLRTELTREYQRAVSTYNLDYPTLKKLSRNSLTYSFLPQEEKIQLQQQLEQQFKDFEKNVIKH